MSDIQIFNNSIFGQVRTLLIDNEPWFVGKDVALALDYQNPSKALIDHIDEEDKLYNESLSSLGQRGGWLINESGLYSLVLSSKLPDAKKFKRWITKEVIPSIRKTGSYNMPNFNNPAEAARAWADQYEQAQKLAAENKAKQKLIEEQQPKVKLADTITASAESIPVNMLAKFMAQKGYKIGEVRLFKYLRENGYIGRRGNHANVPCQRYIEMGLFEIQESTNGEFTSIVPMVTGKGQLYFINKFTEGKIPEYRSRVWVPKSPSRNFGAYNYED